MKQGELAQIKYYQTLEEEYLLSLTCEKKQSTYNLIDTYIATAAHINDFDNNPLKALRIDDVNYYDRDNILRDFSMAKEMLLDFIKSYYELLVKLDIKFDLKHDTVARVMSTLDLCFNKILYVKNLIEFVSNTSDVLNLSIFGKTKTYLNIKTKTSDIYLQDKLRNVDAKTAVDELANTTGFLKKLKVKSKWKKCLKGVLQPTHRLNGKKIVDYYKQIEEYNDLLEFIESKSSALSKMIGLDFVANMADVSAIEQTYRNTRQFLDNIQILSQGKDFAKVSSLFIDLYATQNPMIKLAYGVNANKLTAYREVEANLCKKYAIEYRDYASAENDIEKFVALLKYASNANHFNEIIDIANVNRCAQGLENLGLQEMLRAIAQSKFSYKAFRDVYDLSCANGYIKLYFTDDAINYFNPSAFEAEVKRYRQLIDEYNNLVVACVSAKLTQNLNHNSINYANSSPIGRLKKSISSNGRGVSIRETLLNYDGIIKKYFPCFLMSPLSAAQYLAVDEVNGRAVSKFDLVIFDEASQIPTHEAVGPIARGNSLIVAGDPEQMPPSAYFSAGLELAEDEVQYEDAVSLLDECIAIELPRIRLSYHYRSKHESLISFSNHNFYNDNLYTFPSPNTANSLVEFNFVKLQEDKKNSGITKEELNAICNKFKAIYTEEKTKHKSVGIIVFNMKQQEKVFDAITELLQKDKVLNKAVAEAEEKTKEAWFVKSLENVQGDERDVIILSVGFRKNAAGRAVVMGPIARENGQRRLNVAVSRSKEKMIVISTIKYTDFDEDTKIKNKGQLLLKRFLKFAEENTFRACGNAEQEKGTISALIKQDLIDRGLNVVSNVGNSDFRVDLAVMNKAGDRYELGILIDSRILGNDISCRDKMYVQKSVLNALKWKIIDIYSVEYFKDKTGTINKIIEAINAPYVKEEHVIKACIEKAPAPKFQYNCSNYNVVRASSRVWYDNDNGFDNRLRGLLTEIISVESPVAFETIKTRVREYSNIQSMSAKAKARLQYALDAYKQYATQDQDQMVYWASNQNKDMTKFRINSDRDLNDIPKEEVLCAMKQVLAVQGQLSREDLFRFTLDALGYGQAVLSKKNQDRLAWIYGWAKRSNKIQ